LTTAASWPSSTPRFSFRIRRPIFSSFHVPFPASITFFHIWGQRAILPCFSKRAKPPVSPPPTPRVFDPSFPTRLSKGVFAPPPCVLPNPALFSMSTHFLFLPPLVWSFHISIAKNYRCKPVPLFSIFPFYFSLMIALFHF